MSKSLKYSKDTLSSIQWLKDRHVHFEEEPIRLGGQKPYEQTTRFYTDVIKKLTDETRLLPIGYRHIGTFYLKKPYSVPIEFIKMEGSIFMREDLVSWQIEKTDDIKNQFYLGGYCRTLYKQPDLNTAFTREDAVPVYMD